MRRLFNAAKFGSVMFTTVFVMAVVSGVIVNLIYEFDFSERSLWLLCTLAFLAGAKAGFVCFLLGIFNVYWKIGSNRSV